MRFRQKLAARSFASALAWVAWPALGQECPPGDWFCEPPASFDEPAVEREAADDVSEPVSPAPSADEEDVTEETAEGRWAAEAASSRSPAHASPAARPLSPARRARPRPRWGVGMHLSGALFADDDDVDEDARMAGLGFGLRLRPVPHFAIDGSIELAFGTDYNGFRRHEAALMGSAVLFANPRDRLQVYGFGGLNLSAARVTLRPRAGELPFESYRERYSYVGVHLGGGLELRLTKRAALRGDILGFVRGRSDRTGNEQRPEFTDPQTHRTTDVSGAGLVRLGALFYW